jgi:hypothetical protein
MPATPEPRLIEITPKPSTESGEPTARPVRRAARTGGLGAAALVVACAAVCALPFLVAAGAAVGAGLLASGAWLIGVGFLALTLAGGGFLWLRGRRTATAGAAGCGCGGACAC